MMTIIDNTEVEGKVADLYQSLLFELGHTMMNDYDSKFQAVLDSICSDLHVEELANLDF